MVPFIVCFIKFWSDLLSLELCTIPYNHENYHLLTEFQMKEPSLGWPEYNNLSHVLRHPGKWGNRKSAMTALHKLKEDQLGWSFMRKGERGSESRSEGWDAWLAMGRVGTNFPVHCTAEGHFTKVQYKFPAEKYEHFQSSADLGRGRCKCLSQRGLTASVLIGKNSQWNLYSDLHYSKVH